MIPFLVADYAYGRNQGEDDLMCVLVIRIYPYGYYWSCVVDKTGILDEQVVARVAQLIQRLGLVQLAYRPDREASLTAMMEEACRLSGRNVLPHH